MAFRYIGKRIKVKNPIVEMDGDEMTKIIWKMIKDKVVYPFLDLRTEYFDLSIENRDKTDDKVTLDAGHAVKANLCGCKCATITPDEARVEEFKLKKMWKSPNGTIRNILDGTTFREPIVTKTLPKYVPGWEKPIVIGRHTYGDQYRAVDFKVPEAGKCEIIFTGKSGKVIKETVMDFKGPGCAMGMHNINSSIEKFARGSFEVALQRNFPLFLSTKNTILKQYDGNFKQIFEQIYEKEYKEKFAKAGLTYTHLLIDDIVAQVIKGKGGIVWACKNYDGDVQCDIVAQGFGSLGMMTSFCVAQDEKDNTIVHAEAAHGTVQRHYYQHLKGLPTSTNSVASIYAWTTSLKHRAKLDDNKELYEWCEYTEKAVVDLIDGGVMTKDLAVIIHGDKMTPEHYVNTTDFLEAVGKKVSEAYKIEQ